MVVEQGDEGRIGSAFGKYRIYSTSTKTGAAKEQLPVRQVKSGRSKVV